jgi:hypothetical protein
VCALLAQFEDDRRELNKLGDGANHHKESLLRLSAQDPTSGRCSLVPIV